MIQAPGMNRPGTEPHWLNDVWVAYKMRYTEQEWDATSPEWKRRCRVMLRGIARGEEQLQRKANSRRPK